MPGLCDKDKSAALRIREKSIHADKVVSFRVDNRDFDENGVWEELFIIYNASDNDFVIDLPAGGWQILANGQEADCCVDVMKSGIAVGAGSGMLLGKVWIEK